MTMSMEGVYSGGFGTAEDPYQIADVNDLLELGATTEDYDKHFIMTADIDMEACSFTTAVIAPDTPDIYGGSFDGTSFQGIFDGCGYAIINLTIDTAGASNGYLGLFGKINNGQAEVKRLSVENVSIWGNESRCLGGLCGSIDGSTITEWRYS